MLLLLFTDKILLLSTDISPCAVCFEDRIERCCLELAATLENLNNQVKKRVEEQLIQATDSLMGYVRYHFYEAHGTKWGRITKEHPLFPRFVCTSIYAFIHCACIHCVCVPCTYIYICTYIRMYVNA